MREWEGEAMNGEVDHGELAIIDAKRKFTFKQVR